LLAGRLLLLEKDLADLKKSVNGEPMEKIKAAVIQTLMESAGDRFFEIALVRRGIDKPP
jgi:hypothetical protein